jgi:hypothetical protein
VEFNGPVSQKVDISAVARSRSLHIDARVLLISDGAQIKQGLIELGESWEAVGTQIHVVEFEIHDDPLKKSTLEIMR